MTHLTPASCLMAFTVTSSSLLALTSANWFLVWVAMEINLLGFIPMMSSTDSNQETEACVKYFLAQALGSALMILSSMSLWTLSNSSKLWPLILILSLLLKLGSAPCHFWFPGVMTSLAWPQAMILTTWQKLAPLSLICFSANSLSHSSKFLITASVMMNALIGGVLGMNQTHLRTLLAYSSITHMGWMISAIQLNIPLLSLTYFLLYSLVIIPLFVILNHLSTTRSTQLLKSMASSSLIASSLVILFLSLAGLPPLTGFLPKWLIILALMHENHISLFILLLGSFLNLYYYLNLTFNLISSMLSPNINPQSMSPLSIPLLILPATASLGFVMLIYALTLLNQS